MDLGLSAEDDRPLPLSLPLPLPPWMPGGWDPPSIGGPLGEALQTSLRGGGKPSSLDLLADGFNLAQDGGGEGEAMEPSPQQCVLQKTPYGSLSESSSTGSGQGGHN